MVLWLYCSSSRPCVSSSSSKYKLITMLAETVTASASITATPTAAATGPRPNPAYLLQVSTPSNQAAGHPPHDAGCHGAQYTLRAAALAVVLVT